MKVSRDNPSIHFLNNYSLLILRCKKIKFSHFLPFPFFLFQTRKHNLRWSGILFVSFRGVEKEKWGFYLFRANLKSFWTFFFKRKASNNVVSAQPRAMRCFLTSKKFWFQNKMRRFECNWYTEFFFSFSPLIGLIILSFELYLCFCSFLTYFCMYVIWAI